MKHLKTFEQYDSSTLPNVSNEAFLGIKSKQEREQAKEQELRNEYNRLFNSWKSKGYKGLTSSEMDAEIAKAKADNFEGKWGVNKDKKMHYRLEKDVKWAAAAGHNFGSGE